MKTPAKAIIYDSECPLCAAYTNMFVRMGLLQEEERISFSELHHQEFISRMDKAKQGNEIPLVDLNGGETLYGVDALLCLIGRRWPRFSRVFKKQPLYFIVRQLYAIISYNRRIILAKNFCTIEHGCAPDFHRGYRIAFIAFAAVFASWISWQLGKTLARTDSVLAFLTGEKMLLICGSGWLLTILSALIFLRRETLSYLGHLATLQITGVLVLIPAVLFSKYLGLAGIFLAAVSVICSSTIMLRGHIRRVHLLGISQAWTVVWFGFLQSTAIFFLIYFLKN